MKKNTAGIHHISAIVGNPQENVDFYAGVLGLRLVKKTVNFDDPETYHLYFGNEDGTPGTIITFFPWSGSYKGRIGDGQVGITTYIVPEGSFSFWENRLTAFGIDWVKMDRLGEQYLRFEDPHGLKLELVERDAGNVNSWEFNGVSRNKAIKGFGGAVLFSSKPQETAVLLENIMGFERVVEEGEFIRFKSTGELGNIIDLRSSTGVRGLMGIGTVHHIAWRAADDKDQLAWKEHLETHGYRVTPVQDRNYFNAIYFREHGEILFEIATDPPGFAIDEPHDRMGERLMLPQQYEKHRTELEKSLAPIEVKELDI
ncbi:ring-cleaving dioxygenase [Mesobacillus subterraneus]|uniref:ring-cleaving dioxygenase n=1 Tax=Mesobacillus subterraneus TaxID=285983 RepID=UPI00203D269A|nr:ring-cleaving dioxygenase [Mesobacillus subterraneus]MCM3575104.1 ring-cleaving dioxygenase [Mesobacillus subterraneus]